jgi:hypothetical protein
MPNENQDFLDMTWMEKINFVRAFSRFPAITVMVFIRRKIGFRMMNPTWLIILAIIMLLTPVIFKAAAAPFGFLMVIYALALLGLGFFRSHGRVGRFLDPAAVAIVALLVGIILSHGLGIWLLLSAFFLYVHEQDAYQAQLNRDLDTLDGLVAAEVQAETVKHFEGKQPEEQRSIEETAGIPTGLAPDIHRQVELRRAKQRKPAPDNLAPETPEGRA